MTHYSERLRALNNATMDWSSAMRTRLLDFLRRYVELFGSERDAEGAVPNHLRQEDIAQPIGSTRQTVTATLRQLEREGLVCYSRQRIRLGRSGCRPADIPGSGAGRTSRHEDQDPARLCRCAFPDGRPGPIRPHLPRFNVTTMGSGVDGYDPVAYLLDRRAVKGDARFSHTYQGATFHFVDQAHKDRFVKDPQAYLPAYGGWCAYAMGARNEKVTVDPETFKTRMAGLPVLATTGSSPTP